MWDLSRKLICVPWPSFCPQGQARRTYFSLSKAFDAINLITTASLTNSQVAFFSPAKKHALECLVKKKVSLKHSIRNVQVCESYHFLANSAWQPIDWTLHRAIDWLVVGTVGQSVEPLIGRSPLASHVCLLLRETHGYYAYVCRRECCVRACVRACMLAGQKVYNYSVYMQP